MHEIPGVLRVGSATSCHPTSGLSGEEGDPGLAGGWAGLQMEPWISFSTCTWLLLRQEPGLFTGSHLLATLTPCARKYLLRNRCFIPN